MRNQPSTTGTPRAVPIAVLVGGGILLLAFLTMPFVTLPFLGSLSGVQLAGYAAQEGTFGLLWLVLLAALGITCIGAWLQFSTGAALPARRAGTIVALAMCVLVVLIYLVEFRLAQDVLSSSGVAGFGVSASSLTGAGYWIGLLAAIGAGVGATIGLAGHWSTQGRQSG